MVERFVFVVRPVVLLLLAHSHIGFIHCEFPAFVLDYSQFFYQLLLDVPYSFSLLLEVLHLRPVFAHHLRIRQAQLSPLIFNGLSGEFVFSQPRLGLFLFAYDFQLQVGQFNSHLLLLLLKQLFVLKELLLVPSLQFQNSFLFLPQSLLLLLFAPIQFDLSLFQVQLALLEYFFSVLQNFLMAFQLHLQIAQIFLSITKRFLVCLLITPIGHLQTMLQSLYLALIVLFNFIFFPLKQIFHPFDFLVMNSLASSSLIINHFVGLADNFLSGLAIQINLLLKILLQKIDLLLECGFRVLHLLLVVLSYHFLCSYMTWSRRFFPCYALVNVHVQSFEQRLLFLLLFWFLYGFCFILERSERVLYFFLRLCSQIFTE